MPNQQTCGRINLSEEALRFPELFENNSCRICLKNAENSQCSASGLRTRNEV